MCMNGKCDKCGAVCKAPEPKFKSSGNADALGVAKKNAAEAAVAKARGKRHS